jgi:hypothetical protein
MTAQSTGLYTGLDQIIAKPTRPPATEPGDVHQLSTPEAAKAVPSLPEPSKAQKETAGPLDTASGASFARRLEPDPPEALPLYRKQTLQFGPKELETVQRLQQAMAARQHEISKNDLVRAALEFLAKDFTAQKDDSYLVRKFVRR